MTSSADIGAHFAFALQLGFGFVFLAGALPKLRHPTEVVKTVAGYGIGRRALAPVLALGLVATESFLAFAFLTGWLVEVAVPIAALALVGFFIAVAINVRRGADIPCGCFGDASERVSARSLSRLAMLLVALLALVALTRSGAGFVTLESVTSRGGKGIEYLIEIAGVASFLILAGVWLLSLPELAGVVTGGERKERAA